MKTKKSKKGLIVFAGCLLLCVALAVGVYFFTRPAGTAGEKVVSIVVDAANGAPQTTVVHTSEEFLGPMLLAEGLAAGENNEYGLFITEAGGTTADAEKQEWWCITKAGEEVFTGASETPIADGDQFELTLMTGY